MCELFIMSSMNVHRRKKARERQQKLMEEFANKQKAFMEQAMDTDGNSVFALLTLSLFVCFLTLRIKFIFSLLLLFLFCIIIIYIKIWTL